MSRVHPASVCAASCTEPCSARLISAGVDLDEADVEHPFEHENLFGGGVAVRRQLGARLHVEKRRVAALHRIAAQNFDRHAREKTQGLPDHGLGPHERDAGTERNGNARLRMGNRIALAAWRVRSRPERTGRRGRAVGKRGRGRSRNRPARPRGRRRNERSKLTDFDEHLLARCRRRRHCPPGRRHAPQAQCFDEQGAKLGRPRRAVETHDDLLDGAVDNGPFGERGFRFHQWRRKGLTAEGASIPTDRQRGQQTGSAVFHGACGAPTPHADLFSWRAGRQLRTLSFVWPSCRGLARWLTGRGGCD